MMGGAGIPPEVMAMLEQIAAQEGVSVEELLMSLAAKQASLAIEQAKQAAAQVKVNTESPHFRNLQALCKEALTDVLQRGKRP